MATETAAKQKDRTNITIGPIPEINGAPSHSHVLPNQNDHAMISMIDRHRINWTAGFSMLMAGSGGGTGPQALQKIRLVHGFHLGCGLDRSVVRGLSRANGSTVTVLEIRASAVLDKLDLAFVSSLLHWLLADSPILSPTEDSSSVPEGVFGPLRPRTALGPPLSTPLTHTERDSPQDVAFCFQERSSSSEQRRLSWVGMGQEDLFWIREESLRISAENLPISSHGLNIFGGPDIERAALLNSPTDLFRHLMVSFIMTISSADGDKDAGAFSSFMCLV